MGVAGYLTQREAFKSQNNSPQHAENCITNALIFGHESIGPRRAYHQQF